MVEDSVTEDEVRLEGHQALVDGTGWKDELELVEMDGAVVVVVVGMVELTVEEMKVVRGDLVVVVAMEVDMVELVGSVVAVVEDVATVVAGQAATVSDRSY